MRPLAEPNPNRYWLATLSIHPTHNPSKNVLMKENPTSQSGIFNRRTITLLVLYRLVRVLSLLAVVGFLSSRADAQFLYVNNNGLGPNMISAFHFNSAGTL